MKIMAMHHLNMSHTVPKQIVDIVDLANSVDNLSKTYRKELTSEHIRYRAKTVHPKQPNSNVFKHRN